MKLPSHRWFLTYVLNTWLENTMWKPANLLAYCQQVYTTYYD